MPETPGTWALAAVTLAFLQIAAIPSRDGEDVLIVAVALAVATVSPALATTLDLPSGDTVVVPADSAANAGNSGQVGTGGGGCDPPDCGGSGG